MPSNIEAEQAVLGSLLLSKEKYPEVDALINPGDFESEAHREIYECIKQLADEGKGIDHITVSKQLDRKNSLQRVGGVDYLKELQTVPVSALAADSYANLVKDQSIDRNLKKVLQELIKTSDDPKGKTSDEINFAIEKKICLINAESKSEIQEINKIAKKKNKKVHIGIRLNPNTDAKTLKQISTGKSENKFGVDSKKFYELIKYCENSKNISLQCLSVHIGSQILDHKPYERMLKAVSNIINKTKYKFKFVDLGGGMGLSLIHI